MSKLRIPAIVGVIFSRADLWRAVALPKPPDLFELRLDALAQHIDAIEDGLKKLKAPLIITARHPAEGGKNHLSSHERRSLLLRFLPRAAYVDVELRAARSLVRVLKEARAEGVGRIASFHDLKGTPHTARFDEIARVAHGLKADFLKIATRIDKLSQFNRLDAFFLRHTSHNIAVMGLGRLGRRSRMEFAAKGSALNYAHLGTARVEGQLSIAELRLILARKFP